MQNKFEQSLINNLDNKEAMGKLSLCVAASQLYAVNFFDIQLFGFSNRN